MEENDPPMPPMPPMPPLTSMPTYASVETEQTLKSPQQLEIELFQETPNEKKKNSESRPISRTNSKIMKADPGADSLTHTARYQAESDVVESEELQSCADTRENLDYNLAIPRSEDVKADEVAEATHFRDSRNTGHNDNNQLEFDGNRVSSGVNSSVAMQQLASKDQSFVASSSSSLLTSLHVSPSPSQEHTIKAALSPGYTIQPLFSSRMESERVSFGDVHKTSNEIATAKLLNDPASLRPSRTSLGDGYQLQPSSFSDHEQPSTDDAALPQNPVYSSSFDRIPRPLSSTDFSTALEAEQELDAEYGFQNISSKQSKPLTRETEINLKSTKILQSPLKSTQREAMVLPSQQHDQAQETFQPETDATHVRARTPDQEFYDLSTPTISSQQSTKCNDFTCHANDRNIYDLPLVSSSTSDSPQLDSAFPMSRDSTLEATNIPTNPQPVSSPELYKELDPSSQTLSQNNYTEELLESSYPMAYSEYAQNSEPYQSSTPSASAVTSPQLSPADPLPRGEGEDRIVTTVLEHYSGYGSPLLPLPQFMRGGRHSITSSVGSYADTDSTASLSTGRRSPQSFAGSNRESYDMRSSHRFSIDSTSSIPPAEDIVERRRSETKMKRKPLYNIEEPVEYKDVVQNDKGKKRDGDKEEDLVTPTRDPNALKLSILDSFDSSRGPSQVRTSVITSLEEETIGSPAEPDPEIAALYLGTTQFLNRPISILDNRPTLPLVTSRGLTGVAEGNEEGFDAGIKTTQSQQSEVNMLPSESELTEIHKLSSASSTELDLGLSLASPKMVSVSSKLNRPPVFDFREILASPHSEDRRAAFENARVREFEYDSGIQTWLEKATANVAKGYLSIGAEPGNDIFTDGVIKSTTQSTMYAQNGSHHPLPVRTKSVTMASFTTTTSALKAGIAEKLNNIPKASGLSSKLSVKKGIFGRGRKLMKSSNEK